MMSYTRRRFLRLSAAGTAALAMQPWTWTRAASSASWQSVSPLPWATQEVYGTVWDGQIVVAGGLRSGPDSDRRFTTIAGTALFDPATETWTEGPDLPEPRHHIVLATVDGTVYGFGGFIDEGPETPFAFRNDIYAFDGTEWGHVGTMPTPLGETVALSLEGRIHLVTGSLRGTDGSGASGTHLVFDPAGGSWTEARPVPTARSSATGAVIDGQLYVAAGRTTDDGVTNLGALERYDPDADEWTELRPLPRPSGGLNGAALDGTLYVFGGEYFDGGGGVYEHTWAYDPAADEWGGLPPMPTPRHGLAGEALDGRVFAIGGNTAAGVGAATAKTVEALLPSEG